MLTLLIETCTPRSIVSIMDNDHCLYMAGLPSGSYHSKYLVPKIEEGFECIGKNLSDLDLIAVGSGPGSYTGIRVGVVVAKSISYACKLPLVGVCTLMGFVPDKDCRFASIIDAKMSGFYLLTGKREKNVVTYKSDPQLCFVPELEDALSDVTVLVTPKADDVSKKLSGYYLEDRWEIQESAPNSKQMIKIAQEKYKKGEYSLDGTVKIIYMRQ